MTATHSVRLPRWVGVLIIVMAIVTTGQTAWYATEQQRCNESFARNLAARVQWQAEDRRALHALIVSVFTNDADAAQQRAFEHWRTVTTENDRARAAQPLPALASCD